MVNLVNSKDGTLRRVNDEALYEIEAVASVFDLEVYSKFLEVERQIHPTVDIESDSTGSSRPGSIWTFNASTLTPGGSCSALAAAIVSPAALNQLAYV